MVNGPVAQYERLLPAASFMAGSNGFQTFSGSAGQDVAAPGPDLLGEVLGAELPDPRQAAARPVLIALDDVAWDDPDVAHESRPAHAG